MAINPLALKLQTNIKLTQDPNMGAAPLVSGDAESSFADHMMDAVQNVASGGHKVESSFADHMMDAVQNVASGGHKVEALTETSNDASELAVAMDQFLVELGALKALVDETRKAIDRIFQEARS